MNLSEDAPPGRIPEAGLRSWPAYILFATHAALLAAVFHPGLATGQPLSLTDPVSGFDRPFGLAGHACKQYDDSGRLFIYTEGLPSIGIISWMQRSDGGTKANVAMPEELETALPLIPGCLPGKHHAAARTG